MSLESRLNKLRIAEALKARDHAVQQMEVLCASNRSKESTIAKLQRQNTELQTKLVESTAKTPGIIKVELGTANSELEQECRKLEQENVALKGKLESLLAQCDKLASPRAEAANHAPSLGIKVSFQRSSTTSETKHFSNSI